MDVRPAHPRDDAAAIAALVERSPLSERKVMDLESGEAIGTGHVATNGGDVVGYLHLHPYDDHWSGEIATERLDAIQPLVKAAIESTSPNPVRIWALDPDHAATIETFGHEPERVLWQLRRPLPPDDRAVLPASVQLATFRPGFDDTAWLELNNVVFAGHPENGHWQQRDLADRMATEWFDPEGFLLAWEYGRLVGSCWTKRHPGTDLGEIYVIGVHPEARGRGLGVQLTLAGLWDLHDRAGAGTALLYVDGANDGAMRMYGELGFERHLANRCYLVS